MKRKFKSINTLFSVVMLLLICIPVIQCIAAFAAIQPFEKNRFKNENTPIANPFSRFLNPSYFVRRNKVKKDCREQAQFMADYITENSIQKVEEGLDQLSCFGTMRFRFLDKERKLICDSQYNRNQSDNPVLIKDFDYNYDLVIKQCTDIDEQYYREAEGWEKQTHHFIGFDYYDGFYYYKDFFDGKEIDKARAHNYGFISRISMLRPDMSVFYTCVPFFSDEELSGYVLVSYKFKYAPVNLFEWIFEYASYLYLSAVAAVILVYILKKNISRPVTKLSENAAECKIVNGKIEYKNQPVTKSENEISRLADTFEELVNRLNSNLEDIELYSHAVPHSFKNPLAAIRNEAEKLAADNDNPEIRKSMESINQSVYKIDEYLARLKEYNHAGLESSDSLEEVPLNQFALNIISRIKPSFPETEISYSGIEGTSDSVSLYPECFEKIFENLVENAASFGTKVLASVSLVSGGKTDLISITVEDNGPGVPEEERENIFKFGYSHRENRYKKSSLGTGMGLAIVKKIVSNQLNGSISVSESEKLGGAAFSVIFEINR